jgi:hypothetical protein
VDHETPAFPAGEGVSESRGTLEGVEVEDRTTPLGSFEARGLVGPGRGTGGDHQLVVLQAGSVVEEDPAVFGVDTIDRGLDPADILGDGVRARLRHLVWRVLAEWDEEVAGLVVVLGTRVDDRDRPLVVGEQPTHLVDEGGAGGPGAQHQEMPDP